MKRSRAIEKLAICNRGEVAVRIIRASQEMGIETVLLHSEPDVESLAFRLADETVCIGPAAVGESYLNIEANIEGARAAGADAIHPGFGFLSENPDFAQACDDAGMIFVGPSAESIRLFGDKVTAKELVARAGGPTIPGYQGEDQSLSTLISKAEEIGFPVMVKAAAGGGGRGLKVIRDRRQAKEMIESAQREGMSAFGSERVFLEKYLHDAKHIEVQIFGDSSGQIHHLFERDCSVQRRHQKIMEEGPSVFLNEELRSEILSAAVAIGERAKYKGAGTVEFLVQGEKFYFMEMNTRLQVEHPVTEMIMGVDLVKAQILTAMGQGVHWEKSERPRGFSLECRLYAEDPFQKGIPSTGRLGGCLWPAAPGRRFEVGFEPGDSITPFYDSMVAKVVVWDETRPRAIQKMKTTLRECILFGIKTNIPLLLEMLSHPEFVEGTYTTRFFEEHFGEGLAAPSLSRFEEKMVERLQNLVSESETSVSFGVVNRPNPWIESWER